MSQDSSYNEDDDLDLSGLFKINSYSHNWTIDKISNYMRRGYGEKLSLLSFSCDLNNQLACSIRSNPETEWSFKIYESAEGYAAISAKLIESAQEPLTARIEARILACQSNPDLQAVIKHNFKLGNSQSCFFSDSQEFYTMHKLLCSLSLNEMSIDIKIEVSSLSLLDDNLGLSALFSKRRNLCESCKRITLYLGNEDNLDVVIKCKEREFKACKFFLTTGSEVFRKMFSHDMKETRESIIEIEDIEPETVEEMLNYVHGDEVKFEEQAKLEKLIQAADKYQLNHLRLVCQNKLLETLDVESSVELLMLSDKYDLRMKKYVIMYMANHAEEIYEMDEWKKLKIEKWELAVEILEKAMKRIPKTPRSSSQKI